MLLALSKAKAGIIRKICSHYIGVGFVYYRFLLKATWY